MWRRSVPLAILYLAFTLAGCSAGSNVASSSSPSGRSSHHHRYSSYRHRHRSSRSHRAHRSGYGSASSSSSNSKPLPPSRALGPRTRTSGCHTSGGLPDRACTPGAVFVGVPVRRICQAGYTRTVRNVSYSTKRRVYLEYGIRTRRRGQYEIDHLVPLEVGGSNSIANLWPEAAFPEPGFHQKDEVETYLHDQVCSGAMSLSQAQQEVAANWLQVYHQMR